MNTYFWTDPWIGGILLAVRLSRLFELSVVKNSMVGVMLSLDMEEGGGAWQWQRRLWVWEEDML